MKGYSKNISFALIPLLIISLFALVMLPSAEASHRTSRSSRYEYRSWGGRISSSMRNAINDLDDDPVEDLKVPILFGVSPNNLYDSWGDARSGGRSHEGTDIMAPLGSLVVSPIEAVVTSIGDEDEGNAGLHVYTANPGGERFFFAHLSAIAEDLEVGDELEPGDLIGYVGNTGNAAGGPTHLHLGIDDEDGDADNPFPRLTKEFSTEERMESLDRILDDMSSSDAKKLAAQLIVQHKITFLIAAVLGEEIPNDVIEVIKNDPALYQALLLLQSIGKK